MLPRALALVLAGLALPHAAQAWTRAEVRRVGAQLEVDAQGNAHAVLDVGLKVMGGWISQLELTGLGEDMVLDPDKPPTLWEQDGDAKFVPEVKALPGGTLRLSFPRRRSAPWRGHYVLRVHYSTRLSEASCDDCAGRPMRWTLPPWPQSLEHVVVQVWAPSGTRVIRPPEMDAKRLEVATREQGALSLLTLRRAQLPRTTPWHVELALPTSAVASMAAPPPTPARAPGLAEWWPLALLLALACLAKVESVLRRTRREGLVAVALVPLPSARARSALVLAACGGATVLPEEARGASLALLATAVALSLHRRLQWQPAGPASITAPAASVSLARAARTRRAWELLGPSAWLDATTPLGAALVASLAAVVLGAERAGLHTGWLTHALLLAAPLCITGTRLHGPPTWGRALGRLHRAARRLATHDVRARLSPAPDSPTTPALRLEVRGPAGLIAAHLVVGAREWLGHQRPELALLACAHAGSDAAVHLSRSYGPPTNPGEPTLRWLVAAPRPHVTLATLCKETSSHTPELATAA